MFKFVFETINLELDLGGLLHSSLSNFAFPEAVRKTAYLVQDIIMLTVFKVIQTRVNLLTNGSLKGHIRSEFFHLSLLLLSPTAPEREVGT